MLNTSASEHGWAAGCLWPAGSVGTNADALRQLEVPNRRGFTYRKHRAGSGAVIVIVFRDAPRGADAGFNEVSGRGSSAIARLAPSSLRTARRVDTANPQDSGLCSARHQSPVRKDRTATVKPSRFVARYTSRCVTPNSRARAAELPYGITPSGQRFLIATAPAYAAASYRNLGVRKTVDYTHEREWRVPHDLEFDFTDIEFVVVSRYEDEARMPTAVKDGVGRSKILIMDNYRKVQELWPWRD